MKIELIWAYPGVLRADGRWEPGPLWVEPRMSVPVPQFAEPDDAQPYAIEASAMLSRAIRLSVLFRAEVAKLAPFVTAEEMRERLARIAAKYEQNVTLPPAVIRQMEAPR